MTKDDIIRMAVQCQLVTTTNRDGLYMEALEHFAALVAAQEREACAKILEENAKRCSAVTKDILLANAAAIRARGEGRTPLRSGRPVADILKGCP